MIKDASEQIKLFADQMAWLTEQYCQLMRQPRARPNIYRIKEIHQRVQQLNNEIGRFMENHA